MHDKRPQLTLNPIRVLKNLCPPISKDFKCKMKKLTLDALLQSINEDSSVNSLIQSSPVCHKIFDPDFKLQFMSNSGVVALQIENVEDYYGHTFPTDSAPKITRDIFNEHMHLATKGETNTIEYSFDVDGNVIWFRTTLSPFFNTGGNLIYIKADSMDITSTKKTEESLVQAKIEAEKANSAKSEFLSRMSHELRTPLNAILGFAQIMDLNTTKKLDEGNQENIQHILKAGQHLKLLIDEVLDLSLVESGKIELAPENVPVGPVIQEIISQMEPLRESFGVRIVTENLADAEHAIWVDKMRFKQTMINLISNAIKYNREKGIVSISLDNQPEAIAIRVRDTGVGIPQERMDDLFEPFNRLNYEFGDIEGTGIGLSITKQLVAQMNGAIEVESKVGGGSCFTISFPRGKIISPEPETTIGLDRPLESHPETEPVQILYIEDNPANIEVVEKFLELRSNFSLQVAENAELGVMRAKISQPQVILMDLRLPGMDGFEAFKELNRYPQTKAIPVVALTAHAKQSDIDKALNMGFRAYITKPIEITSFFKTIDSIIK